MHPCMHAVHLLSSQAACSGDKALLLDHQLTLHAQCQPARDAGHPPAQQQAARAHWVRASPEGSWAPSRPRGGGGSCPGVAWRAGGRMLEAPGRPCPCWLPAAPAALPACMLRTCAGSWGSSLACPGLLHPLRSQQTGVSGAWDARKGMLLPAGCCWWSLLVQLAAPGAPPDHAPWLGCSRAWCLHAQAAGEWYLRLTHEG